MTGIASEVKVEKGASLTVTGVVSTIRNDGGTVEINGTVDTLFQSADTTVIAGRSTVFKATAVRSRDGAAP